MLDRRCAAPLVLERDLALGKWQKVIEFLIEAKSSARHDSRSNLIAFLSRQEKDIIAQSG